MHYIKCIKVFSVYLFAITWNIWLFWTDGGLLNKIMAHSVSAPSCCLPTCSVSAVRSGDFTQRFYRLRIFLWTLVHLLWIYDHRVCLSSAQVKLQWTSPPVSGSSADTILTQIRSKNSLLRSACKMALRGSPRDRRECGRSSGPVNMKKRVIR